MLYVGTPAGREARVALFDLLGRRIVGGLVSPDRGLDTRDVTAGTYLLHIALEDAAVVRRVVIQ